jgi:acyl-CoA synthetase (AMP-forming)/AMP-acid ligase II
LCLGRHATCHLLRGEVSVRHHMYALHYDCHVNDGLEGLVIYTAKAFSIFSRNPCCVNRIPCNSSVRFKVACKDATLLNIYGSTEVGADASYAILCSADTPPSAASLVTASLCVDSSQLPQGEGPKSQADIVAHESANDGRGSSEWTPWLIGNAPIGYPIKGNELIIARSCKYGESDDDTVHSHSISSGQGFFELVPDGEPGELFVGGKQLAAGYHNRPEETEKRFLPLSFLRRVDTSAGSGGDVAVCPSSSMDRVPSTDRVFRTGDIVVRIPKGIDGPGSGRVTGYTGGLGGSDWAGALVWLGRSDLQVVARMPYDRNYMATVSY